MSELRVCTICQKELYTTEDRYLIHMKMCASKPDSSHKSEQLRELIAQLVKRWERTKKKNSELLTEREILIEELAQEREKADETIENLKKMYERRVTMYKEHLELKFGKHTEVLEKAKKAEEDLKAKEAECEAKLKEKDAEIAAYKAELVKKTKELKQLQADHNQIISDAKHCASLAVLQKEEIHRSEKQKLIHEINVLKNEIALKDLQPPDSKINIAVSKKENELRQFYNAKIEHLTTRLREEQRQNEERIKKLKEDFARRLNEATRSPSIYVTPSSSVSLSSVGGQLSHSSLETISEEADTHSQVLQA